MKGFRHSADADGRSLLKLAVRLSGVGPAASVGLAWCMFMQVVVYADAAGGGVGCSKWWCVLMKIVDKFPDLLEKASIH